MQTKTNIYKLQLNKIKNNLNDLESLIDMLLPALDNEFNPPKREELLSYILVIKNYINNHNKLLDKFLIDFNLPETKTELKLVKIFNHKEE